MVFRRCPTLPRGLPRSTIGAGGLNFRVRDGTGCFPFAVAAGNGMGLWAGPPGAGGRGVSREPHSGRESPPGGRGCVLGRVPSPRPVSTGQLRPLRGLHFRPINPVVWLGALPPGGVGGLILRRASRLDAFSGYLVRT